LVTDPVPYEPAENIPPMILLGPDTTPEGPVIEWEPSTDPLIPDPEVKLHATIRDYNLDDPLYVRVVRGRCLDGSYVKSDIVRPTGNRDREFDVTLNSADLGLQTCVPLRLLVSDRGWNPVAPPWCDPPTDEEGQPLTVFARVTWILWRNIEHNTDGPPVTSCGLE
jgi:hypothetical protein